MEAVINALTNGKDDTVLKKCVSSKVLIFVVNKKINKEQ